MRWHWITAATTRSLLPKTTSHITTIGGGYDTEDFIDENTPADYGDDKQFRVEASTSAGKYINNTGWTATYTKTTRTWTGGTTQASNATSKVLTSLSSVPVWIGVIIIVSLAFMVVGLFIIWNEGGLGGAGIQLK